jgi:hypothetical protein
MGGIDETLHALKTGWVGEKRIQRGASIEECLANEIGLHAPIVRASPA